MSVAIELPEPLGRGRPSNDRRRRYERELEAFADQLKRIREMELNGPIGKRSWCYYLESEGVVDKGEFEYVPEYRNAAQEEFRETISRLLGDAEERLREDVKARRQEAEAAVENIPIDEIEDMVEQAVDGARGGS